ncbi:DUF2569 family protein [Siccirubricoccus sp. KC 17139]|uniref:DUF2569 family protein n=1 Tax=Siccirubricoccus soli TaxID=2899147 RepID=A0ABT1D7K9_9PROT|nr:DUF2569 family protein [Siccirubricoccus soli]MCO6417908.1 DUF2569 family protein [Siccirubricoccus soli]MCP2684043.1 DUF2569 family protein [Siccirubricoccus soli]
MQGFSAFHWLVVLLVIAFHAVPLYLAISRVRREKREGQGLTPGAKGWLFLLLWGLWVALILYAVGMLSYYQGPDVGAAFGVIPGVMIVESVQNLLLGAALVGVLVLATRRSRHFRWAWLVLAVATALNAPLNLWMVTDTLRRQDIAFDPLAELAPADVARWLGTVLGLALWTAYIFRSRRVALTFTR